MRCWVSKTPDPIDVHVGGRMRLRRMVVGMSQEKLGEHLQLTFQQIQKYEKGVNRIGAGRLYRISQALGVDVSFFFEDLPGDVEARRGNEFSEPDATPFLMDFVATPEGLQLNSAFAKISSPEARKRIVDLVKTLANGSDAAHP